MELLTPWLQVETWYRSHPLDVKRYHTTLEKVFATLDTQLDSEQFSKATNAVLDNLGVSLEFKQHQVNKHLNTVEKRCNIIYCATRTKGATCQHVIERFGDKLTRVQNTGIYNQKKNSFNNNALLDTRNSLVAQMLAKFEVKGM